MEENYESLVDEDIRDEIANMTAEERATEVAKIEREEEAERVRIVAQRETTEITSKARELTAKPGDITTNTEQRALDNLIRAGGDGEKTRKWLIAQRQTGLDVLDIDAKQVVEGQYLMPDKVYYQQAESKLINEVALKFLETDTVLPQSQRDETFRQVSMARNLPEAKGLIKTAISEFKEKVAAEVAEYIHSQAQDNFLPARLKYKIAGLSAKNIDEAREAVERLIRNYRR